ncbi:MAG: phospholipid carrier-dependent glycosyltransferase [Deltaproteobacteria bacterium]|jgi:4-amino-4-deoxy-L-arabinose transferase|nr:phospholipid carrier-dependent glycosyltransferase [Deltaproteobacteria bacterium]
MKKSYLAVIGIFLLLYILPLGIRPMIIPDETRYAEISREMIASGDWIVPTLNGLKYFEKPVLGYWLNAVSVKLFGENAFAVRFPSAAATGISAFMIFLLVRRFSDEIFSATLAASIFLTSFEVYGVGTFNVLDSMLAMFITVSMTSFFFAHHADPSSKKKQWFLLLFGVFCGLAFLTKGFLAFVIPVVAIVPFMIWEGRVKELFVIPWLPIAAAVLVVIPWAVMIHLKAPDFWHFFIWNEHIKRFLSSGAQHHASFWYYILLFPAVALPWTVLFPSAILGLRKTGVKASITRYALCWFLLPFLFFSISKGKILTYILPCFPPFAMLMSTGLNKYFKTGGRRSFSMGAKSLALPAVILAIALIMVQIIGFKGFKPYSQTWKWAIGVFGFMGFAFFLISAARASDPKKKLMRVACAPILMLLGANVMMPDLTIEHKAPGAFLMRHAHRIEPDTMLVADEDPMGAVCWFYKRNDVYLLEGGGEVSYGLEYEDAKYRSLNLTQFRDFILKNTEKRAVVLIAKSRKYERWKENLPEPLYENTSGKGGYVFVQY